MAKSTIKTTAKIADTVRPTIAGAKERPGWHFLRTVAGRITTPLLPDDYLKLANPLWSARELRGRILEVRRETVDSATLVIKPGWGFSFDYQAGQYIGIGLLVDGRWRWRSYSLTSVPGKRTAPGRGARTITITVKAMPEGFLSTHLVGGVEAGTIVRLAAPQGNFGLPDPAPAKVLFLTAGSGITPVMSMLRTLVRRGQLGDVTHVHSAPTEDEVLFRAELAKLADQHEGYRLLLRATRTEGRLDLARLDEAAPDWRERQTWACGPEAMLEAAERTWKAAGIPEQLHLERFAAVRTAVHGSGGTVEFARAGKAVTVDAATSLMDAGEAAGVQMPFGCRMGICQSCVVGLLDGHVRDLRTGVEHEPGSPVPHGPERGIDSLLVAAARQVAHGAGQEGHALIVVSSHRVAGLHPGQLHADGFRAALGFHTTLGKLEAGTVIGHGHGARGHGAVRHHHGECAVLGHRCDTRAGLVIAEHDGGGRQHLHHRLVAARHVIGKGRTGKHEHSCKGSKNHRLHEALHLVWGKSSDPQAAGAGPPCRPAS